MPPSVVRMLKLPLNSEMLEPAITPMPPRSMVVTTPALS